MKPIVKIVLALLFSLNLCVHGQIITTIAGNGTGGYSGDGGPATAALLSMPFGISFDKYGNLFFSDTESVIRKIDLSGIITTVAGTGVLSSSGDGGMATLAGIFAPVNVAFDSFGNMYISEQGVSKIRKVNTSGIISTFAGTGISGNSGDGGPATLAQMKSPGTVMVDKYDNILCVDFSNNNIRKVNTSGIISTIAGTGAPGYSGDGGPATAAKLNGPYGITMDAVGNIYFSDCVNNVIRKIDTFGIITTLAGNGIVGYSGDGGLATSAKLNGPGQVILDSYNNLYFADWHNNVIRKINSSGIISTIAGTGVAGYSGDGGLAISALLNQPFGIAFDSACNLFITEQFSNVIRKVTNICVVDIESYSGSLIQLKVYPNPTSNIISVNIEEVTIYKNSTFTIQNTLGQTVKRLSSDSHRNTKNINVSDLNNGIYFLQITLPSGESYTTKFIKQ